MYKRHGDVLIELIKALPGEAKKLDPKICKCKTFEPCAMHGIFAHGEVSGHVHQAITDIGTTGLDFYKLGGEIFVVNSTDMPVHVVQSNGVAKPSDIEHLEKCFQQEGLHAPIKEAILPGQVIKVDFPQEYNWWSGEIERARD